MFGKYYYIPHNKISSRRKCKEPIMLVSFLRRGEDRSLLVRIVGIWGFLITTEDYFLRSLKMSYRILMVPKFRDFITLCVAPAYTNGMARVRRKEAGWTSGPEN